jgi:hypothetical protein
MAVTSFLRKFAVAPLALGLLISGTAIFAPYRANYNQTEPVDPLRLTFSTEPTVRIAHKSAIRIDSSTIHVDFAPGRLDLPVTKLIAWVSNAARAVTDYYGRFPISEAQILVVPVRGRKGVLNGTSWGTQPAFTRVYVGQLTDETDLKNDWVMTHEMVHYAFPSMPEEHHWIEEGIATYVEPIGRLEAGEIGAVKVWGDLVEGLPLGLPGPGDEGLDHTHSWGRTYWGGAMFCLLADVRIRRETQNRYGLRDALRAIVDAGGNIEVTWPLTRALDVGDGAVGVAVLRQLYNEMKAAPVTPALGQLWSKLGIEIQGKTITFDQTAPWASVRCAIAATRTRNDRTPSSTGFQEAPGYNT